jgi:D-tyrosyl-tRNA(Tyr) deacylase
VVQRVLRASVVVDGDTVGAIGKGLLVLLGAEEDDGDADVAYTLDKVLQLRVFDDADGRLNLSLLDLGLELLVVSQFTLLGDCRRGRRPGFTRALRPELAEPLVERLVAEARARGVTTATGRFRALMEVHLVNDGPVTLLVDSRKQF